MIIFLLVGCNKEPGKGGRSKIEGTVVHHSTPIPNAEVYISYGVTEFPGSDVTVYDDQTSSNASGDYSFEELHKGNYFLYARGYDDGINDSVFGGIPVEIIKKTLEVDVPITE